MFVTVLALITLASLTAAVAFAWLWRNAATRADNLSDEIHDRDKKDSDVAKRVANILQGRWGNLVDPDEDDDNGRYSNKSRPAIAYDVRNNNARTSRNDTRLSPRGR